MTTRLLTSVLLVTAGCSFTLDKKTTQCSVDSDCDHFGGHPTCSQGVCVPSGLGPAGCFFGTPSNDTEFGSQCSTSDTIPYDNCGRLGLCDAAALGNAWNLTATPANLGTIPPPINTEPMPTVNCADLSMPTLVGASPIYVTGSTNLPPLLQAVQPLLYKQNPPFVSVFAPQTSCKGAGAVYDANPMKHLIFNTTNNWAFYYDKNGVQQFCLLATAGNTVDVGESDVYPSSCGYTEMPGIGNYAGPIQAITFVVPSSSSEVSISAEAAHLVFAAGGNNGMVPPFIDPHLYFVRSSGTGTIQLPSRKINLMPTAWWGIDRLSATNLVASMEAVDPAVAGNVIGVLSSDFADDARNNLRTLAFQQQGVAWGYLPDSTKDKFDKQNVRDGHYPIWGAIHLLAPTPNGVPSQQAGALITQFTVDKLDEELVAAIIQSGFIPPCAMKVTHSVEVGPLSEFTPRFGCGCYYDNAVNGGTSCKACSGPSDCGGDTPSCNYGFCEK